MSGASTKDYDWKALVEEAEGEDFRKPPVAYLFSDGKKKFLSPEENGGVYTPPYP